uniref:Ricin B lectin domain-containing protein n=1 Tax=Kwoniella dejecticola CBS 10117 TaxID=1296121 RepID=A0A1A6A8H0_9TREE|nr:uncharacterized protein I303_04075 [Kwoniella dejecticola CBS 10117]OBR86351.1 hypothetical protein I303_04075 [Kwoniella dejecticola CBS 10117]
MFSLATYILLATSMVLGGPLLQRGEDLHKIKLRIDGRCLGQYLYTPQNDSEGETLLILGPCEEAPQWYVTPDEKADVTFHGTTTNKTLVSGAPDSPLVMLVPSAEVKTDKGRSWIFGSDNRFLLSEEDNKDEKRCLSFNSTVDTPEAEPWSSDAAIEDNPYFVMAKCDSGFDSAQSAMQQVFDLV